MTTAVTARADEERMQIEEPACELRVSECEFIVNQQQEVIQQYEDVIEAQELQLQINLDEINDLTTQVKQGPPWYENKFLWFGIGLFVGHGLSR